MEVDLPSSEGVTTPVRTGCKRTHSGELAYSPHNSPVTAPDSPGTLLALIGQIFKVIFNVRVILLIQHI